MKDMKNMPTITEAASLTGASHWTIRRYLKLGIIESILDGNQKRLKPGSIGKIRKRLLEHGGPGGRPPLNIKA